MVGLKQPPHIHHSQLQLHPVQHYLNGRETSSIHRALGMTTSVYDNFQRLQSQTVTVNGRAHTTTFSYYADGSLQAVTDPAGCATICVYDSMGRKTAPRRSPAARPSITRIGRPGT